jgi:PAS domain S-box-containing protein
MKQDNSGSNKVLRLRRKTEEMLTKSASAMKKMSATDIRNLLEDLQIYQVELEEQNKQLLNIQEELKQTGEALLQSEMRYRALFQESREAKSLSKNGKIVEVNAKWLELHGFDDEKEVLGKDVLQFIYEEDRQILEDRRKRWSEKLEAVYELRDVRRDGSTVEVEVYSSRILIGGEVAFLATIHDISERKRLEEQTRKIRKIEAMATLTGGIAQHFNNALSAITAHNWILEMNFSDNEEIMQCVKPMKRATERMADLTAQLLACGFGGRYYPKAILISDYVKTILLSMHPDMPDSVQLEFKPAPDLPRVTADPNQISMAVSAVIVNAVEAVENKGLVRISCQAETLNGAFRRKHPDYKPGPYVCVQVEDNGKGMNSETVARAFDPFFTTHFVGRGLGLSAAYGIVKNHGGFISIESELEKGSTVRLYLPISDDDKIGDQASTL